MGRIEDRLFQQHIFYSKDLFFVTSCWKLTFQSIMESYSPEGSRSTRTARHYTELVDKDLDYTIIIGAAIPNNVNKNQGERKGSEVLIASQRNKKKQECINHVISKVICTLDTLPGRLEL